jgi:hypothetical protein
MSKLAAIITGLALASILLAAGGLVPSVRQGPRAGGEARPSTPIAFEARLEMDVPPMPPKADRLPLPVPAPELPVVTVREEVVSHAPIQHSGSDKAQPRPSEGGARDPVCGARGRTWYTRENGWKYWRCVR